MCSAVDATNEVKQLKELASRPELAFSSTDRKTVPRIRIEITNSICPHG